MCSFSSESDQASDEKKLAQNLQRNYQLVGKTGRPVRNALQPILLKFGMGLISMNVEEKENMLSLSVWTKLVRSKTCPSCSRTPSDNQCTPVVQQGLQAPANRTHKKKVPSVVPPVRPLFSCQPSLVSVSMLRLGPQKVGPPEHCASIAKRT